MSELKEKESKFSLVQPFFLFSPSIEQFVLLNLPIHMLILSRNILTDTQNDAELNIWAPSGPV